MFYVKIKYRTWEKPLVRCEGWVAEPTLVESQSDAEPYTNATFAALAVIRMDKILRERNWIIDTIEIGFKA